LWLAGGSAYRHQGNIKRATTASANRLGLRVSEVYKAGALRLLCLEIATLQGRSCDPFFFIGRELVLVDSLIRL